jgi:hypothetical protein
LFVGGGLLVVEAGRGVRPSSVTTRCCYSRSCGVRSGVGVPFWVFRFGFSVIEDMTITLVFTCCIIGDRELLLKFHSCDRSPELLIPPLIKWVIAALGECQPSNLLPLHYVKIVQLTVKKLGEFASAETVESF